MERHAMTVFLVCCRLILEDAWRWVGVVGGYTLQCCDSVIIRVDVPTWCGYGEGAS